MNQELFNKIQNRLEEIGFDFSVTGDAIRVGMNIEKIAGTIMESIRVLDDDSILVLATLDKKVPAERIAEVAEYLHRANFGALYGNFELDCDEGLIQYKFLTTVQDAEKLSDNCLDRSVLLPFQAFHKYGLGAVLLMAGLESPKELIEQAEE